MDKLFKLSGASHYPTSVEEWLSGEPDTLYAIARHWFSRLRQCGDDVTELLHDGCPVACVEEAAFAYVNVYASHVSVGFFVGAMLQDPEQLLEGHGVRMRHVKIEPDRELNSAALELLIEQAYQYIKHALDRERQDSL